LTAESLPQWGGRLKKGGIMLNYLIVLAVVTAAYYAWVGYRYYRPEIIALFQGRPAVQQPGFEEPPAFVGTVAAEEGSVLIDAEDLDFAEPVKEQLLGSIADFMQELKVLLRVTYEAGDTKENFLMLLQVLAGKYPDAAAIRYAEPIALYILEEGAGLPFQLTKDELEENLCNV
jgi:hypothetical protein